MPQYPVGAASSSNPPPNGILATAGVVGAAGLTWLGTWSSLYAYTYGQAVTYSGSSFVAVVPNIGVTPGSNPSVWVLIAAGTLPSDISSGLVTAIGTTTPRTLGAQAADVVNVKSFGAVGNGIVDDTAAIQAAIAHGLTLTSAVIYFPQGVYSVSALDLTNTNPAQFYNQIRLSGAGRFVTKISANTGGKVIINMTGRNHSSIDHMQIDSSSVVSQAAILLARGTGSPNCNDNSFDDVWVTGGYSKAGVVSLAAESTKWNQSRLENTSASGAYTTFYTSWQNDIGMTSPFGDAITTGSNTANVMVAVEFYSPFTDATPVVFSGTAAYSMYGCLVIGGTTANNVHLVTYKNPITTVFNGPIGWYGCHFEVFGTGNVVHWLNGGGAGFSYFNGISSYGGYYNVWNFSVAAAIVDYDRTNITEEPILQSTTWTPFEISPATGGVHVAYVYATINSTWNFRAAGGPVATDGVLVLLGYISNSDVNCYLTTTSHVIGTRIEGYGTSAPTTGTWSQGSIVHNTSYNFSYLDWICYQSGTLGTLSGVTGSGASGQNILVVNTATGLSAGQVITVAGNTGTFIVLSISGTSVYLNANLNALASGAAVAYSAAGFEPLNSALNGGSVTVSTGVGSVKMSTANSATNAVWIQMSYNGTNYYVPAWTTNSP